MRNNKTNIFLLSLVMVVAIIFTTSCKKTSIDFGQEFIGNEQTSILKIDSFSANLSTVYMDSFITNGRSNIMLGAYTDPIFGRVTTQSYFEVVPNSTWTDSYQNTFFDSLTLILNTNGNYYGDTTKPININVKELKDSIIFPEQKYVFYNHQTFATKPAILGTFSGTLAPNALQKISIRLPDALGAYLLSELKNTSNTIFKSNTAFLNYFRGFQLSSDAVTQAIVNCNDDVVMRLHYRQNGATPQTDLKFDFKISSKIKQFNNISVDRTGTILSGINSVNRELLSSQTANAAYCQSTTNTAIKFSFPSLLSVTKQPNYAKVLKASLTIKPLKTSYSRLFSLPPTLRLSQTDANNKLGGDLAALNSNGTFTTQYGSLKLDYVMNENTQYTYDLTQFVKDEISSPSSAKGFGLLLTPPSPNYENQFARVVIGDRLNTLGSIKLEVYYAAVK